MVIEIDDANSVPAKVADSVLEPIKSDRNRKVRVGVARKSCVGEKKLKTENPEVGKSEKKNEIQEFDETNFPVPAEGSFSLQPSPAVLKLQKQLLVRYNSDDDTEDISDSSPAKMKLSTTPETTLRKVSMCGPALPCLSSMSLDQPGETSVAWDDQDGPGVAGEDVEDVEEVCGGAACGWCLEVRGPAFLQLCSACSSVAYCGPGCQGQSWSYHWKVCKKLKGAVWTVKVELVKKMLRIAKSGILKRKLKRKRQCSDKKKLNELKRKV